MIKWEIASSALICVTLLIRKVFKGHISLRLQYSLWGLVLFRLLIPMNFFDSEWSVINAVDELRIIQSIDILEGIREIEYTDRGNVEGYKTTDFMPDAPIVVARNISEQEFSQYKCILKMRPVLDGIWKSGMLIGAFILLKNNLEFSEKLKETRKKLENIEGKIPVYSSEEIDTPCLFGIIHPAIYVTEAVASDHEVMRYVFAHEITHYRQGDHIWSFLRGICLILHWYNPLVWIAVKFSRQDGELSCDEGTLLFMGEHERTVYGRILIGLTCEERVIGTSLVAATTMMGSKKGIKERIELIAKKQQMVSYVFSLVILVICFAAICTFSGAKDTSLPEDDGIHIGLKTENKIPEAAVEYAQEYVKKSAENYNRMWENNNDQLSVTEAELIMSSMNTGTASENVSIQMYEVGFRMKLKGDVQQYIEEGMKYEEVDGVYWLTEYGNTDDVIYIFLSCEEKDGEEIWTRLGMIHPEDLEFYYGTEEMQKKYGSIYTAAAMEIYNNVNGICCADLNHDGIEERVRVVDTGDGMMYELRVETDAGELLWSETAHTAHTGWNSLFLCRMDGKDYLLRYNPSMSTGIASYDYTLFTLENGKETVKKKNGIGFFVADITEITSEMEQFASEVNQLLNQSQVLLSTEDGDVVIGMASADPYLERYDFVELNK